MEIEIGIEIGMKFKGVLEFEIGMILKWKQKQDENEQPKMEIGIEIVMIAERK